MSIFSSYKKIFLLGFVLVILVAIPFSVYIAQKRQNISSKAAPSTNLSFEPGSSTVKVGETLTLGIMLDPGAGTDANLVSFAKLSIKFDPALFTTTADSLAENPGVMTPIEGPKYESGKASISLSIGADPTKAIATKTKIAILQLKAIAATTTPTSVSFNTTVSDSTQVLSIDSNSKTSENVLKLSTLTPAAVTITAATVGTVPGPTSSVTPPSSPTGTSPAENAPICTSLSVDRPSTGVVPYSLTFTAIGNDSNGTISKASFNFGDGPVQDVTIGGGIGTSSINTQISHTYNNSGTYTVYAILTDNNSNLSAQQASCTKTITVSATQDGSGSGITAPVLPTQVIIQPLPTEVILPPTGPGEKILGIGILGAIFTVVGGALLLLL